MQKVKQGNCLDFFFSVFCRKLPKLSELGCEESAVDVGGGGAGGGEGRGMCWGIVNLLMCDRGVCIVYTLTRHSLIIVST
jgi:hypothetical protein